jgi:hypothetical protein
MTNILLIKTKLLQSHFIQLLEPLIPNFISTLHKAFGKDFTRGLLSLLHYISQSKAIGTQDTAVFVNKNSLNSKLSSNSASMLTSSASEDAQYVVLGVKATRLS